MISLKKKTAEEPAVENDLKRKAQEWLPVEDVVNKLIFTDPALVGALRVQPLNINLKSKNEKRRIFNAITGAYNGLLEKIQIICIPRPVDLDGYIVGLEKKQREQNNLSKRRLLNLYLSYVRDLVSSGEVTEERFYLLVPEKKGKYAEQDLKQRMESLQEAFERAGLEVYRGNDREITDLLFTFSNWNVSAFEREPQDLRNPILHNWTVYEEDVM